MKQESNHSNLVKEAEAFNLSQLAKALEGIGCASILIEYEGGGDEGNLSEHALLDADGKTIDITSSVSPMEIVIDAVWINSYTSYASGKWEPVVEVKSSKKAALDVAEDLAWRAIGRRFSGWENNDGGRGEVTINLKTGSVTVEHVTYIMDESHDSDEIEYGLSTEMSPALIEAIASKEAAHV